MRPIWNIDRSHVCTTHEPPRPTSGNAFSLSSFLRFYVRRWVVSCIAMDLYNCGKTYYNCLCFLALCLIHHNLTRPTFRNVSEWATYLVVLFPLILQQK